MHSRYSYKYVSHLCNILILCQTDNWADIQRADECTFKLTNKRGLFMESELLSLYSLTIRGEEQAWRFFKPNSGTLEQGLYNAI